MKRARTGRADLVRLWAGLDDDERHRVAAVCGYEIDPESLDDNASDESGDDTTSLPPTDFGPRPSSETTENAPSRRVPFWRVVETHSVDVDEVEDEAKDVQPLTAADLTLPTDTSSPKSPLIAPWRDVWPTVTARVARRRNGSSIDVDRVVTSLARGETLHRLPRRRRRARPPEVVVLVDRSRRLAPIWEDQERVVSRLRLFAGIPSVKDWTVHSPRWNELDFARRDEPWPDHSTSFLALTDFGLYDDTATVRTWCALGRRLRDRGHALVGLTPSPPEKWPAGLARAWNLAMWDRHRTPSDDSRNRHRLADELLHAVSSLERVEPGLLREARFLFDGVKFDIAVEMLAWLKGAGRSGSSVAFRPAPDDEATDTSHRTSVTPREALSIPESILNEIGRLAKTWHAPLPEEVRRAEDLLLTAAGADVGRERRTRARAFFLGAGHAETDKRVLAWFRSFEDHIPDALWLDEAVGSSLRVLWLMTHFDDTEAEPPLGITDEERALVAGRRGSSKRTWSLWQVGAELKLARPDTRPRVGAVESGSVVTRLDVGAKIEMPAADGRTLDHVVVDDDPPSCRFDRPTFRVQTSHGHVVFDQVCRADWMSGMGRDRYGLWMSFEVEGVEVRMRWIRPGRFWMGSPEDEPGRWHDETRHRVTLTRGYWLAETPCVQELWEAVTEENPSQFPTSRRPVERVSWDDVQKFIRLMNERLDRVGVDDGLLFRLPTEAEWEWACRAETTTATYAGDIVIEGQSNAPILDDTTWYRGNSGVDLDDEIDPERLIDSSDWNEKQHDHDRAATHIVATKRSNPWGLFDMLGNVNEWCADYWINDLGTDDAVDPVAPGRGDDRVLPRGLVELARSLRACGVPRRVAPRPPRRRRRLSPRPRSCAQRGGAPKEKRKGT